MPVIKTKPALNLSNKSFFYYVIIISLFIICCSDYLIFKFLEYKKNAECNRTDFTDPKINNRAFHLKKEEAGLMIRIQQLPNGFSCFLRIIFCKIQNLLFR